MSNSTSSIGVYSRGLYLAAAVFLGLAHASVAHANPARLQALGNNSAFIDDTEVLVFPSYIGDIKSGAMLTYNQAGGADVMASLDDDSMIWLGRGVPASLAGGQGPSPWQLVYGMDKGDTGQLFRTSWQEGVFSLGGAWSRGDFQRNGESLAFSGDLRALGALDGDGPDTEFNVDAEGRSRTLDERSIRGWTGRLSHSTATETSYLGGLYAIGPRLSSGNLRAALVTEPGLFIIKGKKDTALAVQAPSITVSGEFTLTEWMVVRGSGSARWMLDVADASDFTKTDKWSTTQAATLGMGFKKDDLGRLDLAMNPIWMVNGPHVLSGVSNPAFLMVTAQGFY